MDSLRDIKKKKFDKKIIQIFLCPVCSLHASIIHILRIEKHVVEKALRVDTPDT